MLHQAARGIRNRAAGLRCFDHVCRRTDRSVLGDFAAALAVRARAKGEADAAIASYGDALARYEADSLTVPADLECAYGNTLAASRSQRAACGVRDCAASRTFSQTVKGWKMLVFW